MNHVGIDLGSKQSQVCVRAADGVILHEKKYRTETLPTVIHSLSPCRLIVEASSGAFRVADAARTAGHEVRVVPATLAKQLGIGERGIKTDQRDARALSEVSRRIDLPSIHIPTAEGRDLRAMVRGRETLIETRTKLVNYVRAWVRTQLLKLGRGTTASLPERVRAAHQAQSSQPLPSYIEQALVTIETLNTQVLASDREMKKRANASELCRRLMTVPGVGPITSLAFVGAIDEVSRFSHAYRLTSYLGLTPGEDSSSERQRRTGITKAGSRSVRRALIQAAWVAYRTRPNDPMVQWAAQIATRRNKFVAVVALARKMASILYALWRDNTTYRADRSAQPQTQTEPDRADRSAQPQTQTEPDRSQVQKEPIRP